MWWLVRNHGMKSKVTGKCSDVDTLAKNGRIYYIIYCNNQSISNSRWFGPMWKQLQAALTHILVQVLVTTATFMRRQGLKTLYGFVLCQREEKTLTSINEKWHWLDIWPSKFGSQPEEGQKESYHCCSLHIVEEEENRGEENWGGMYGGDVYMFNVHDEEIVKGYCCC